MKTLAIKTEHDRLVKRHCGWILRIRMPLSFMLGCIMTHQPVRRNFIEASGIAWLRNEYLVYQKVLFSLV